MSKSKVTGLYFLRTAEGIRVSYTYSEIEDDGTVKSNNNRGSYIDLSPSTESFLDGIEKNIEERIDG